MIPVNNTERLHGSLEGTLREPGLSRAQDGDHTVPPEKAAREAGEAKPEMKDPPLVLYGRLGYIRRDLAHLDGAVHHNPPSDG